MLDHIARETEKFFEVNSRLNCLSWYLHCKVISHHGDRYPEKSKWYKPVSQNSKNIRKDKLHQ
jgi:hypothetical protein